MYQYLYHTGTGTGSLSLTEKSFSYLTDVTLIFLQYKISRDRIIPVRTVMVPVSYRPAEHEYGSLRTYR